MNKVLVVGRLGHDPKFRTFEDGKMSARFSVATTEYWTDKSTGERCEETEWHNIVVNGRLADICQKLQKGSLVSLEGRNRTRKYKDREGIERSITQVAIMSMEILDGRKNEGSPPRTPAPAAQGQRPTKPTPRAAHPESPHMSEEDNIPF